MTGAKLTLPDLRDYPIGDTDIWQRMFADFRPCEGMIAQIRAEQPAAYSDNAPREDFPRAPDCLDPDCLDLSEYDVAAWYQRHGYGNPRVVGQRLPPSRQDLENSVYRYEMDWNEQKPILQNLSLTSGTLTSQLEKLPNPWDHHAKSSLYGHIFEVKISAASYVVAWCRLRRIVRHAVLAGSVLGKS